jgi:hypothetical protein
VPDGTRTVPPPAAEAASTAFWIAALSLLVPFPVAP